MEDSLQDLCICILSIFFFAFDIFFPLCFSEHDLAADAHLVEDNVQDQNQSFSKKGSKKSSAKAASEDSLALASQEQRGPRKRGRPAGTGIKKIKTDRNQARRARSQIAKKRAKISEYESDESDSLDIRPYEQEADITKGNIDFHNEHLGPHETEKTHNVQGTEVVESSERNKGIELEDFKDNQHENLFVPKIEMCNDHSSHVTEKLEIMTDPVQAMLLDMIPSLAMNKVEQPTNHHAEEEKPPEISHHVEEEKPPEISNEKPPTTKKKKVSLKAIAGDLLNDW
jgi:DNA ligase-4